jgi:hypothetical protein
MRSTTDRDVGTLHLADARCSVATIDRSPKHQSSRLSLATIRHRLRLWIVGTARLLSPGARGVYHPQPHSAIVLGVALPPSADVDAIGRQLWWRGLGIVARDGQLVAGADVTLAVQQRRARVARAFVTKQLRDAGVRGPVRRFNR